MTGPWAGTARGVRAGRACERIERCQKTAGECFRKSERRMTVIQCPQCGSPLIIKKNLVTCVKAPVAYDPQERIATGYDVIEECTNPACDYCEVEMADLTD